MIFNNKSSYCNFQISEHYSKVIVSQRKDLRDVSMAESADHRHTDLPGPSSNSRTAF